MNELFVKRGTPQTSSLLGEAAALRWLAEAEAAGGMPVAEVVSASGTELVERRVKPGPATRQVAERLKSGDFEAPQPAMLSAAGTDVARIHGDLWSGNLLWSSAPANPVGAVLIDPMAHGGHAETDLAMLALFGCPYLDRIVAPYDEASSLAYGWRDRIALHQLAPLLHHCALFGRSYAAQALAAAKPYV